MARPINTTMKRDEWERYVKRMMHKPNSGISDTQGKQIFEFLIYDQDEAQGQEPEGVFPALRRRDPETEDAAAVMMRYRAWRVSFFSPRSRFESARRVITEYPRPMSYSITIPDQDYFDRNIPCRTACPIHTECGRYVQAVGSHGMRKPISSPAPPIRLLTCWAESAPIRVRTPAAAARSTNRIAICALKRYVTDRHNLGMGHDPARKGTVDGNRKREQRVAIIGSGVCGLTCAHDLALLGYTVEVFESAPVPGGMLYLGIPHFRLPREIIKMEVDNILGLGRHAADPYDPGPRHHARATSQSKFDAVMLATG